MRDVR